MSIRDWQKKQKDILFEMEESKRHVEYLIEKSRSERINRINNNFSLSHFEDEGKLAEYSQPNARVKPNVCTDYNHKILPNQLVMNDLILERDNLKNIRQYSRSPVFSPQKNINQPSDVKLFRNDEKEEGDIIAESILNAYFSGLNKWNNELIFDDKTIRTKSHRISNKYSVYSIPSPTCPSELHYSPINNANMKTRRVSPQKVNHKTTSLDDLKSSKAGSTTAATSLIETKSTIRSSSSSSSSKSPKRTTHSPSKRKSKSQRTNKENLNRTNTANNITENNNKIIPLIKSDNEINSPDILQRKNSRRISSTNLAISINNELSYALGSNDSTSSTNQEVLQPVERKKCKHILSSQLPLSTVHSQQITNKSKGDKDIAILKKSGIRSLLASANTSDNEEESVTTFDEERDTVVLLTPPRGTTPPNTTTTTTTTAAAIGQSQPITPIQKLSIITSNSMSTSNASSFSHSPSDEHTKHIDDSGEKKMLKKELRKSTELITMLKSQLVSNGVKPIEEVVPLEKAEENLRSSLQRLMEGDEKAEDEFTRWDEYVRNHADFKNKELKKKEAWRIQNEEVNQSCLSRIWAVVPSNIFKSSITVLEAALPTQLAKRIWMRKALWLTRMPKEQIAKVHVADLQTKYSAQGLDEVELRALWASLPLKFENDPKEAKAGWRNAVLDSLNGKVKPLPDNLLIPRTENGDLKEESEEERLQRLDRIAKFIDGLQRNSAYNQLLKLIATNSFSTHTKYGPFPTEDILVMADEVPTESVQEDEEEIVVAISSSPLEQPARRHSLNDITVSGNVDISKLIEVDIVGAIDRSDKHIAENAIANKKLRSTMSVYQIGSPGGTGTGSGSPRSPSEGLMSPSPNKLAFDFSPFRLPPSPNKSAFCSSPLTLNATSTGTDTVTIAVEDNQAQNTSVNLATNHVDNMVTNSNNIDNDIDIISVASSESGKLSVGTTMSDITFTTSPVNSPKVSLIKGNRSSSDTLSSVLSVPVNAVVSPSSKSQARSSSSNTSMTTTTRNAPITQSKGSGMGELMAAIQKKALSKLSCPSSDSGNGNNDNNSSNNNSDNNTQISLPSRSLSNVTILESSKEVDSNADLLSVNSNTSSIALGSTVSTATAPVAKNSTSLLAAIQQKAALRAKKTAIDNESTTATSTTTFPSLLPIPGTAFPAPAPTPPSSIAVEVSSVFSVDIAGNPNPNPKLDGEKELTALKITNEQSHSHLTSVNSNETMQIVSDISLPSLPPSASPSLSPGNSLRTLKTKTIPRRSSSKSLLSSSHNSVELRERIDVQQKIVDENDNNIVSSAISGLPPRFRSANSRRGSEDDDGEDLSGPVSGQLKENPVKFTRRYIAENNSISSVIDQGANINPDASPSINNDSTIFVTLHDKKDGNISVLHLDSHDQNDDKSIHIMSGILDTIPITTTIATEATSSIPRKLSNISNDSLASSTTPKESPSGMIAEIQKKALARIAVREGYNVDGSIPAETLANAPSLKRRPSMLFPPTTKNTTGGGGMSSMMAAIRAKAVEMGTATGSHEK